jgi:hypothetical protein
MLFGLFPLNYPSMKSSQSTKIPYEPVDIFYQTSDNDHWFLMNLQKPSPNQNSCGSIYLTSINSSVVDMSGKKVMIASIYNFPKCGTDNWKKILRTMVLHCLITEKICTIRVPIHQCYVNDTSCKPLELLQYLYTMGFAFCFKTGIPAKLEYVYAHNPLDKLILDNTTA